MVSVMHREFIRTEVPGETQKMDDLEKKIAEYEDFQPEIKKLEIDLLSISGGTCTNKSKQTLDHRGPK